ncbi:hypothetical protein ADIMK_2759 [Marinobacterium lacunae]|uniref:Uncharacterized protein n=1 Tax=Marinobacterium lacunae TaxID=1232683 RepID=A0A081FXI0_9GAMM|nr:hypothetical protein [Marinobacterium lacunae]KEA63235.1 hypothetical protein ADIMK_2759 [Marinobacterium lacunae]MBR9882749.1 hypothetical protein [Oceanospirillales bacterium]
MTYQIDAWLERKDPELRVTLRNTGVVLLHWHSEELKPMLESGLLNPHDFCCCQGKEKELVRELFLIACMDEGRCGQCRYNTGEKH